MITVAVISTGDMGGAVARRLRDGGLRVVTALEGRSERTRALAAAAGAEDVGSVAAAAGQAGVLLSILPPGRAVEVARAVGRDRGPLYVDCNAVSPATALQVAAEVGERFVDAGIIGAPSAPRLYVCGPHAGELTSLPLDVRVLDGPLGTASALKMCYAALTKGLTALLTESMVTADALGVTGALHAELADSQPQFLAAAQRQLPSMVPKAYRWIAEMEEIAATFAAAGMTPLMLQGAADVYRLVERTRAGAPASSLDDLDPLVRELRRALNPLPPAR